MHIQNSSRPAVARLRFNWEGKSYDQPENLVKDSVNLGSRETAVQDPRAQATCDKPNARSYSYLFAGGMTATGAGIGAMVGGIGGLLTAAFLMLDFAEPTMKTGAILGAVVGALSGAAGQHSFQTGSERVSGFLYQKDGQAWFESHPQEYAALDIPPMPLGKYPLG